MLSKNKILYNSLKPCHNALRDGTGRDGTGRTYLCLECAIFYVFKTFTWYKSRINAEYQQERIDMGLSIDKNVQQIAFREHKSKDMSIPNQPVKTQSSYKGVDVLMGLTAIASTVIAGIALHNNNVLKKELKTVSNKLTEAEKTIQETAEKLKNQTKNEIPSFNANETVNEIMTNNQTSNTGKKVIKKSKNKKKVNKQQVEENSTQEGLRILEEDASDARKARKASDRRNQEWLEKQHRQKEQEINEFYFQNAGKLNEMESLADKRLADRWVKEQENNAEAVRKARKASDRRNQEWLEKQHRQKEQEYSDFWNKELNEKETQEGLRILEEDASVARKARKASDRRNQEWLEKQHRQKEKEYSDFWNKELNEKETQDGLRILEEDASAARKARKATDRRNQEWLEKQHKQKEQEYSDFWNKELNEKETQDGLRILEEDASAARKARKASDRRNQEWLEKQHRQKEQEINEFYSQNAGKLNEMESLADKRLADRWVKEQENNAEAVRKARKASDRRNQEWLEKQHRQKELEMNEFYNQHNLRLGYLNVKANVRHFVNSKVDSVKNCFRKIQDKFSKDA